MPTRGVIACIVIFWLFSMGLLVVDVLPYFQTGDAPQFVIEITDEVGSAEINWDMTLTQKGEAQKPFRVRSRVDPVENSEYLMTNEWTESVTINGIRFKTLRFAYRVSKKGDLRGLTVDAEFTLNDALLNGQWLKKKFIGEVKDGVMYSSFESSLLGRGSLGEEDISNQPGVLNPMQLLHRLPPMREGQEWSVTVFDPLNIVKSQIAKNSPLPRYRAVVSADTLLWGEDNVPCLKIEYHDARGNLHAATWVRRSDRIVLKQWSTLQGDEIVAIRQPHN